jgi:heterodisulfide reductase subunit C
MKIDFELREKIIAQIPELKRCFQCGTCVSSCPAKLYSTDFSPREFIMQSLHGMQKGVINDHLWKCLTCNRCNERCPQDVNPYEVVVKLKNIAVREGWMTEQKRSEVMDSYNNLIKTGNAYPVTELTKSKRAELGLKEIKAKKVQK